MSISIRKKTGRISDATRSVRVDTRFLQEVHSCSAGCRRSFSMDIQLKDSPRSRGLRQSGGNPRGWARIILSK